MRASTFLNLIDELATIEAQRGGFYLAHVHTVSTETAQVYRLNETSATAYTAFLPLGFAPAVNQTVVVSDLYRQPIIIGVVQPATPSYSLPGPLTVTNINTPLMRSKAQTAADVTSTTSTSTFQDAITLSVTLPAGTWDVHIMAGCLLSHSAGNLLDRRVIWGASNGSTFSASTGATREHYATSHTFAAVAGGSAVTAKMQYKSGDVGTSAARAPWIIVYAERVS